MHLFIHQMWLEGAFNIMDLNQANTGIDLSDSKLLNKMNQTSAVRVDGDKVRKEVADIKQNKTEARKDIETRRLHVLKIYTSQPTLQRKQKAWQKELKSFKPHVVAWHDIIKFKFNLYDCTTLLMRRCFMSMRTSRVHFTMLTSFVHAM